MARTLVLAVLAVFAAGLPASVARADTSEATKAFTLFEEGKRLVKAGRATEACPKFVESVELLPKAVTLLNLADCYERTGRMASAWRRYVEATKIAEIDDQAERRAYAEEHAHALEPHLGRLTIILKEATEGAVVRRNNEVVPAEDLTTAVPVDAGSYAIDVSAPGRAPYSRIVEVQDETQIEVVVPRLPDMRDAAPATTLPAPPPKLVSTRAAPINPWPFVAMGAGAVSLGVGLGLAIAAKARWNDAEAQHCHGTTTCDVEGAQIASESRNEARWATVPVVAGALLVGGGAIMYLWSRGTKHVLVAPTFGPHERGAALRAVF
jgi:hypothetical protein